MNTTMMKSKNDPILDVRQLLVAKPESTDEELEKGLVELGWGLDKEHLVLAIKCARLM